MVAEAEPRYRAVLFDLDGTLIDTRPGMLAALRSALRDVLGDDAGSDEANLSLPLEAMVQSAAPAAPREVVDRVATAFRAHYDAGDWRLAEIYPGAEECLRTLQRAGVRAFVVTNKRSTAASRILGHANLASYFERVVGQPDTAPPRPKAELARECSNEAGLAASSTVVVGDSDHDALMAASQGMTFIAFTGGAGPLSQPNNPSDRLEMGSLADVATFVTVGTLWRKS